jgi:glucose/arabinose dehydrogenase
LSSGGEGTSAEVPCIFPVIREFSWRDAFAAASQHSQPVAGFLALSPEDAWVPAISPAGLTFYTGDKIKDWKGKAILGGLSSEAINVVSFDGNKVAGDEIIEMGKRIRELAQAPDGAVLLLLDGESGGDLLRLTPADDAEAG